LGHPLGHSFSRAFFNNKFAREGIDAEYLNFDLPSIDMLPQVLADHPNLRGLNVTLPYKKAVIPFLDDLSDEARAIGAVNVIRISPSSRSPRGGESCQSPGMEAKLSPVGGENCKIPETDANGKEVLSPTGRVREGLSLKGFNSDIIGFMDSIRPLLRPHHRRALVLGTGGASRAICRGLELLGLEWRYVSRQPQSVSAPGDSPIHTGAVPGSLSAGMLPPLTYASLSPTLLAEYTVIVNCTPLGMYPNVDTAPPIAYAALSPRHLLYDLVYNPEETLFMRQGRRFGATVKGGLEMLHLQALASWRFWNEES
jgi:shikimate dehydrogenase